MGTVFIKQKPFSGSVTLDYLMEMDTVIMNGAEQVTDTEEVHCGTYVCEEAAAHPEGRGLAGLQRAEEGEAVEVVQLLQVSEDAPSLSAQGLRHIRPLQQGVVVRHDVS